MCRRRDCGRKQGGNEPYWMGRNMGVKLRKWEKYMRVGGLARVNGLTHRLVEIDILCVSRLVV